MKKGIKEKWQTCLRSKRQGFSLVEIIIVIAIMAILVGVIALSILPYLARSKESKDLSTLDNIGSALKTAVAETKISGNSTFCYGSATAGSDDELVQNAMEEVLGETVAIKLQADANTSAKIYCKYDTTSPNHKLMVFAGTNVYTATESVYNETGYDADLSISPDGKAFVVGN